MAKSLVLNRTRKVPAEDTAAFGAIAERFRRAGALERAVELCREGLQKFPDHISARVTLGWSLLDLGKYDEARVELEQVLRRAPDNLAAIRGLAELHDRFEHTLHLPMDGPGQWPPPPDSMDDTGPEARASATAEDQDSSLEMTPAALGIPIWSPAVTPTPAAEAPPARAVSVLAQPPSQPPAPARAPAPSAASAPAPVPAPIPAPAPTPAATPVPAPAAAAPTAAVPASSTPAAQAVTEPPKAEAVTAGSGMSSVREIDFAPAASETVAAAAMEQPSGDVLEHGEVRAEAVEAAPDSYAVSDADIQALLAEAESLDAAALPAQAEAETVSLESMALGTVSYSSVTEPISVDLDLDAAPAETTAEDALTMEAAGTVAAAEFAAPEVSAVETMAAATLEVAPPVAESALEAEELFEAALEVAAPIVEAALVVEEPVGGAWAPVEPAVGAALEVEETFEAALEVAAPIVEAALVVEEPVAAAWAPVEPAVGAAREVEETFEAALEIAAPIVDAALAIEEPVLLAHAELEPAPEPDVEIPAAARLSPAVELSADIDLVSEIDVAPAIEAVAAAEVVELASAAVAEVVSIEVGRTAARSPVPALERFLTKVQARRAQLMAESVA